MVATKTEGCTVQVNVPHPLVTLLLPPLPVAQVYFKVNVQIVYCE